ncbi:siroheme synthase CysG [Candidatus Ishikawella capsulata]|uniref:Siroheme synthase n=1 Tax=Candidatus Ishikawaella capsulata Mpkobe TaxID=476281 RepID=C5WCD2_9ENTR|nr:siroheme synthase CysG [Candidatus Ishikawaella capsulata]BAH82988.1 fused siroheme synthase 1,3-dimethyluroporphyriongen III dehydrogenase and siroheme ferrochelatase/uroporphyrinogen methyltransferase [Candidatus Ishikawaella capsulata Mpkobe]
MHYLPIFTDLNGRSVLVVGGGNIAARKIRLLNSSGANVKIVAHKLCKELQILQKKDKIKWIANDFHVSQLKKVFLVVAATNDNKLNKQVFTAATYYHKLVNVVDNPVFCSFIFPSIINRSPIIIGISSSGTAPVLSRLLREKIEALLPTNIGKIAKLAGQWRDKVKQKLKFSERRYFWERLFTGLFPSYVTMGNIRKAQEVLVHELNNHHSNKGEIILVGAGPGDSGLLTLRALQVMQLADVVLYDYLVSKEVLEMVRRDAEFICVGKRAGYHSISQEKTNDLLIKLAKQGKRVVRLKGGDPFIFGRGAEELQAAYQAGIPFQVVPGITAAIGASIYAGIPLTHRDYAQKVIFITAQGKTNKNNIDWLSLACERQTLAIYMSAMKAAEISAELIKHGRSPQTPVAVISSGTNKNQQVLIGQLKYLEKLSTNTLSPTLLVIGEVVDLHKQLTWFHNAN